MNDTERKTNSRSPNSGPPPRHAGVTREWPMVGYVPKRLRPEQDEATVPVPVPVDPFAMDADRTHEWSVVNVKPSPMPRMAVPPTPPQVAAEPRDWRDRWADLPRATRAALIAALLSAIVVAAVLLGVGR